MRRLISVSAREDILRQYRYLLVEEDSPAVAERFLKSVETAIKSVCRNPGLGAPRKLKNPKLLGLRSWPVEGFSAIRIYYLVEEKALRVVRVLHGRRDTTPILEDESDPDG